MVRMSSEQDMIFESLKEYVMESRYQHAALLTGEWGSGKTWFMQNVFIPGIQKIDDKIEFCSISLYGVHTLEELEKSIKTEMLKLLLGKNQAKALAAIGKIGKIALPIISDLLHVDIKPEDLDKIDWQTFFSLSKKVVLVLDDMERAEIEIGQLMGYINNWAEQEHHKVIILSNEDQVGQSYCGSNHSEDDGKLAEGIKAHYMHEKEKVIGLTIHYAIKSQDCFAELVEKYAEESAAKTWLNKFRNAITAGFEEKNCGNLRTWILAFIVFDKLCRIINELLEKEANCLFRTEEERRQKEDVISELMQDVLLSVVSFAIVYKHGEKQDKTMAAMYGLTGVGGYRFKNSYPFIKTYIEQRRLDEGEMNKRIRFVVRDMLDKRNSAYYRLFDWHVMEDGEVEANLTRLKSEISQTYLNPDYIRNLFMILIDIQNAKFGVAMDDYVYAVLAQIRRTEPLLFGVEALYAAGTRSEDTYNEVMKPIFDEVKECREERKREEFKPLIENAWDEDFAPWCVEKRASFMQDNKFLGYMNLETISEKLRHAAAKEIWNFGQGIARVYEPINIKDFYGGDIPYLGQLLKVTETVISEGCGKVKTRNLEQLKQLLEEKRRRLEV